MSTMYLNKCDIFRDRCRAWCCRQFEVITNTNDADLKQYLELHGIIVKDKVIIIPVRCKLLNDNNKCSKYSIRPKICRKWTCKKPLDTDRITMLSPLSSFG